MPNDGVRHALSFVLVCRGPKIAIDGWTSRRIPQPLRHEDRDHLLVGIGGPRRTIAAFPPESSRHPRYVVSSGDNGETKPPTARRVEDHLRSHLLLGGDLIRRHGLDRALRQDAFTP